MVVCLTVCIACSSAFADGFGDCGGDRQPTKAEKDAIRAVVKTIHGSLPDLPKGWEMIKVESAESAMPSQVFDRCPIWFGVMAEYGNNGNAIDLAKNTDAERLVETLKEMQAAMMKGDKKKAERLEKQLAGVGEKADNVTALIMFRVNSIFSSNFDISRAKPIFVEGAAYAFYNDTPGDKKVGLYVGRWKQAKGNLVNPWLMKDRPGHEVQLVEIVITGEIALELARRLDVKLLASLIK